MNINSFVFSLLIGSVVLINNLAHAQCDNYTYNFSVFAVGNGSDYSLALCKQEAVDDCRADALSQLTPQADNCRSSCRDHGCSNFVINSVAASECSVAMFSSSEPYFCLATGSYVWGCTCF